MSDERLERLVNQFTTTPVTMADIGAQEGITRERVRQLLGKAGLTAADGFKRVSRSVWADLKVREEREARCLRRFGCDWATVQKITGRARYNTIGSHPLVQKWSAHKANASRVMVPWKLTLAEYAEIVGPHMHHLGLGKNCLVLTRKDKTAPYTFENAALKTLAQSSKDTAGFEIARGVVAVRRARKTLEIVARVVEMKKAGATLQDMSADVSRSVASISQYLRRAKAMGLLT